MRFTLEKHLENTWKNDPEKWCEPWATWNLGPGRHGRATPPAYRLSYSSNWVALYGAAAVRTLDLRVGSPEIYHYAMEPTNF